MNIEITNDFSASEQQFIIELQRTQRDVPYTMVVDKYVFDHPMQFLKAMTDGLVDEIDKAGLTVLRHGTTQDTGKLADAMVKPVEKAQRQESVDPEEEIKTHLALTPIGRVDLRAKALELAIQEIDNMGVNNSVERERLIFNAAQRFYTTITKGE